MAKQARARRSWKKYNKKSKKRNRELHSKWAKGVVAISGFLGTAILVSRKLKIFERAQKRLKQYDTDLNLIQSIANSSGVGWDDEVIKIMNNPKWLEENENNLVDL